MIIRDRRFPMFRRFAMDGKELSDSELEMEQSGGDEMTREQFINWLVMKFYQSKDGFVRFDEGSVITQELMGKILDALKG